MSEYNPGMEHEMDWDSAIEHDSEYTLLPEGDYKFTVTKFERARHPGSDKLPPCNKAILTIEITDGAQKTSVRHNLFLHSRTEGMICAFFSAIGQRKHGERIVPKWDQVVGATGSCRVVQRKNYNNDGMHNEISRFYEKDDSKAGPPAQQPQQPQQQNMFGQTSGYTPGSF